MKSIKKYVGIFLLALCLIGTMQAVPCKAASLNSNVNGIVKSQVLPEDTKEVKVKGKWYIFDTNMDKFKANSTLKYYNILKTSKAAKKVYKNKGVKYVNIK